jgi:hypothetical protein
MHKLNNIRIQSGKTGENIKAGHTHLSFPPKLRNCPAFLFNLEAAA